MEEERRSENWRGVRIGAKVFVAGSWEGNMEMWRGLFCMTEVSYGRPRTWLKYGRLTLRPITPRQAIDGIAAVMAGSVVSWR